VTVLVTKLVEINGDSSTVVVLPDVMVAPGGQVVTVSSTITVVMEAGGAELSSGTEVGLIGMLDGQSVMIPGLLGIKGAHRPTR
jgi:hypothetical protein